MNKKLVEEFKKLKSNYNKYDENLKIEYFDSLDDVNITNIYFQDIKNIPLLTEEEEVILGNNLKLIDDLKIVTEESKNNKRKCAMIDLGLVFRLCCDNKDYELVINSLLLHFNGNENIFYKELGKDIGRYKDISNRLGRALTEDELKKYFKMEAITNEVLNFEELLDQVTKYLRYKEAFDKIFCANLRLVASIASKYKTSNNFLDLINIGNESLIVAINKYDVSLGYKFSTYATWWIISSVREYVLDQKRMVKLSHQLKSKLSFVKRKIYVLEQQKQRELTVEEIALELGISISKLTEYLSYERNYSPLSLDMPVDNNNDYYIGDYIESDICIEDEVIDICLKENMEALLKNLTPRELDVIKLRYGFDEKNSNGLTLREVGSIMGVSHEMVRLIEQKAFKKIRKLDKSNLKYGTLKDYLD